MRYVDLRDFISQLESQGELKRITAPVSPALEMTEIADRVLKGGGPALADNVAGNSQLQIGSLPGALPFIKSGRLRLIAMGGPKRNPAFPDVPTINESGLPGYESQIWFGLFAPAGTPREVIARMNAEMVKVMARPDVKQQLASASARWCGRL